MQKDDANGAYGVKVDSNGRNVVLSSQHTTNGTSAKTSVSSAQVTDEVIDSKTGAIYTVSTGVGSGGTQFTISGAPGYSYTTIRGGDISTNNVTLMNDGALMAGKIKINSNGIVAGNKKITSVADGAIAEGSKEAVNGGQVYSLKQELEALNTKIEANVTGISSDDANIEVKKDEGSKEYKIGLQKDLSLTSAEFTSETDATQAAIDSKGMTASDANSGAAAAVSAKGLTASDNKRSVSFTTEGISAGGQTIQNVADGEVDTDAVNFGQLNREVGKEAKSRADADAQLQQRMDEVERGLDGRFDKLGDRIDKVGAGAAALAALHPLDYDPDDKLNFAVGLGNYRGEQAAALGAFYRPNEAVMFSVGGTMGNDDNMVNLGVSFALDGKRGKAKESRAQLEQKVESMSSELAEVKAQLALLMQQNNDKR